jgi:HEAT repeat protein
MTAALGVRPLAAQTTTPRPAALQPATTTSVRLLDPATVLRGNSSTQAERDEAARRLVQKPTPAARAVLLAALQDLANRPGQIAAAKALSADPDPDPGFIAPLFAAVSSGSDPLIEAAIAALANYRGDRTIDARLMEMATDARQPPAARRAAIKAMGQMSDRAAARTLVTLVAAENEPPFVHPAAGDALAEMTGLPASVDAAQWQQWLASQQNKSDAQFEHDLLEARAARLARLAQRFDRVVAEAQAMLIRIYQSTPEKNREAVLLDYLRANEAETRLVGVKLVQEDFIQNRPPSPAAREELRRMVGDSSAQVRIAVARALTLLNDPGAVAAVLEQLKQEPDAQVRAELARTLAPTRDIRVVEPLLALLKDPSPTVVQVAADALRELGPVIQKDPALSLRVAEALRDALQAQHAAPGSAAVRAALVDAMGALQNPELRMVYTPLLRPTEPPIVRRAALRALGRLEQPWAAEIIVNSLDDADDDVRLEAVNALDTTANFTQAEKLYSIVKSPTEKPAIRQRAWTVLRKLFTDPSASNEALYRWADRFKEEPERRIEILTVLRDRHTAARDLRDLATVQQNIGEDLMKLADAAARQNDLDRARTSAEEADKYFEQALGYYRNQNPMVTSALMERRMDALLLSRQYSKATGFAATSISADAGNQEAMGRKLRNEVDRLRTAKRYSDAVALIDAVNAMNPRLAEPFASSIKTIEAEVRQHLSAGPGASAVGSGR